MEMKQNSERKQKKLKMKLKDEEDTVPSILGVYLYHKIYKIDICMLRSI